MPCLRYEAILTFTAIMLISIMAALPLMVRAAGECVVQVKDINSGGAANPRNLTNVNGTLYFVADSDTEESALWKSDGTADGTSMVRNIVDNKSVVFNADEYANLTNLNGTLFFRGFDKEHSWELWKSDGTPEGTVMVKDICPGACDGLFESSLNSSAFAPNSFTTYKNAIYFNAYDPEHGIELWKSDGTTAGTTIVKDIATGVDVSGNPNSSLLPANTQFFKLKNGVYFTAYQYKNNQPKAALWHTDGTADGTIKVSRIGYASNNPGKIYDIEDVILGKVNGKLLFNKINDSKPSGYQSELWATTGIPTETYKISDAPNFQPGCVQLPPGPNSSGYCVSYTPSGDSESLWKTDGTPEGTYAIMGFPAPTLLSVLATLNDKIMFTVNKNRSLNYKLWTSDGTPSGTAKISNTKVASVQGYTQINGNTFITGNDGIYGNELWKTDGTAAGTAMVKDINPGPTASNPYYFTATGGQVFFNADDGTHGGELWKIEKQCIESGNFTP